MENDDIDNGSPDGETLLSAMNKFFEDNPDAEDGPAVGISSDLEYDAADDIDDSDDVNNDDGDGDGDDEPLKEDSKKKTDAEQSEYDRIMAEIKEMYEDDPHPGIKFTKVKQENKGLKDQLKSLSEELEKAKLGVLETEEVSELRARANEYEALQKKYSEANERLTLIDYESTPEYENSVIKPYNEIERFAEIIEKDNGLEAGTIMAAISHSDRKSQDSHLSDLQTELGARDITRVMNLADKYLALQQVSREIREQSAVKFKEHQERQISLQKEQLVKSKLELSREVDGLFSRYEGKIPGFVDNEGNPTAEYNELKTVTSNVDFNNLDSKQKAFFAFASNLLPEVLNQMTELHSQNIQLKQLNKKLTKAKPNLGGGSTVSAAPRNSSVRRDNDTPPDDIRFRL